MHARGATGLAGFLPSTGTFGKVACLKQPTHFIAQASSRKPHPVIVIVDASGVHAFLDVPLL